MTVTCGDCGKRYDDAERDTGCPHPLLMPLKDLARKDAAYKLFGKGTVRFAHQRESGPDYRVQHITWNGYIGLDGMTDKVFAPDDLVPHKPE